MDRAEAAAVLRREMVAWSQRSYSELAALIGQTDACEREGGSVTYQVEIDVLWDSEPGGTIRVLAGIDDGGFLTSLRPVTDGFLARPDGTIEMADLDLPVSR